MSSEREMAVADRQITTDRMIVTRWSFAPGAQTGWHRHGHDYCVVPLTDGQLRIESATGETRFDLVAGASYHRPAGVEHNVVNASDHPVAFVEIELPR
ncbi:MAG: cupin domain-containing protein [Lautropia sp.]